MNLPAPENELSLENSSSDDQITDPSTIELGNTSAASVMTGDPLIGTTVIERYTISSVIGFGGWSVVYRAYDTALNRWVAIKAMHQHLCVDQSKLLRFQREAQASSGLTHQNIAVVYDCGLMWAGRPYISMEFVEGESLAETVKAGESFDFDKSLTLFMQICNGLEAIHKAGLVHRDLKPSNIKVSDAGIVKVLDFGCAKWILQEQNLLTRSDESVGTPAYMSPEQCLGQPVDARSDIYALGCIMYEVITGKRPFSSDNLLECMRMHIKVLPPKFRVARPDLKIPDGLEAVVFKALAKDPNDRYASAEDLRKALADSLLAVSFKDRIFAPWQKLGARRRRKFILVTSVIALIGVVCSIALYQSMRSRSITFPDGHDVGSIYIIEQNSLGQDVGRNRLGPAQGTVRVPLNSYVQLAEVPASDASTLTFLQKVRATDLQRIDLTGATVKSQAIDNINFVNKMDTVSLNGAKINDEALEKLKLADLVGLNLSGTSVSDRPLFSIARNCPKLRWVALRGNTHVTDVGAACLAKLTKLTALMFQDVPRISDLCLIELSKSKTLTFLGLRGDNISDAGVSSIASSASLKNLDLSATHITDGGISSLSKLSLLQLNLSETKISDSCVPALAAMKSLKTLNISSTSITPSGIGRLKSALSGCEIRTDE